MGTEENNKINVQGNTVCMEKLWSKVSVSYRLSRKE